DAVDAVQAQVVFLALGAAAEVLEVGGDAEQAVSLLVAVGGELLVLLAQARVFVFELAHARDEASKGLVVVARTGIFGLDVDDFAFGVLGAEEQVVDRALLDGAVAARRALFLRRAALV